MAKVGDTVRYLNAVGGGVITRIDGKMAYVDEDGFETPVLLNELVVVLPEGHAKSKSGGKLMFDQAAVDAVKARDAQARHEADLTKEIKPEEPKPIPVVETEHGDKLNLLLAFEPLDIKRLSQSKFAAVLVNDSNYYISFTFLTSADGKQWSVGFEGTVEPNMVVDLATFGHEELGSYSYVGVQAIAFKRDKTFSLKPAIGCSKRLDLKKFYKLHCFRAGVYFDNPVLEVPLVLNDTPVENVKADAVEIKEAMGGAPKAAPQKIDLDALEAKYGKLRKGGKRRNEVSSNPNKLLPPIEIDLHINELVDTTAGMQNADMLNLQLDTVRRVMKENQRRLGQKIIFIHGKGDGVLREAVRSLLRREWSACELQDASFREYGFGATLVTVHKNG
ncbi:MAG: DUF2027 domain-containing protein [Muribaculaceae bacterium]|nr:DUF2027 domain-containing protein [Muribaculaceae bacterium]